MYRIIHSPEIVQCDETSKVGILIDDQIHELGVGLPAYGVDEAIIGRWIDGKPVYRRVYPNIFIPRGTLSITIADTAELSVDTPVRIDGSFSVLSPDGKHSFRSIHYQGAGNLFGVGYGQTALTYNMESAAVDDVMLQMFLEYTKTTDEATIDVPSAAMLMEAYEEGVQEA